MTEKQERFIDEYLIDLNGTQAAIRAGYSPKTANEQAARLLANVSIRAEIDKKMAERSKRTGINQDRVLLELARIALVNPKDVIDLKDASVLQNASPDDMAAVASVKIKKMEGKNAGIEREVKFWDKLKALELTGKHLGMFKDKVEIETRLDDEKTKLDDLIAQMRGSAE